MSLAKAGLRVWEWPGACLKAVTTAVLIAGGKSIGAVQTALFLDAPGRRFSQVEMQDLRKVFGNLLDLKSIRLKEGSAGLFSLSDRPFALGNGIHTKHYQITASLLVHECVHQWQRTHGVADYTVQSLVDQALKGSAAYVWRGAVARGVPWSKLHVEQQAHSGSV